MGRKDFRGSEALTFHGFTVLLLGFSLGFLAPRSERLRLWSFESLSLEHINVSCSAAFGLGVGT